MYNILLDTYAFVGFDMSTKQCCNDLCILLNLKRGFLADVFWEIRKRECIVQK